jgi:serine protease AprX
MPALTTYDNTDETHDHTHAQNRFAVIPAAERLNALTEYTGKGITIAFLDSGFYPHADLTQPVNRIVAWADITNPNTALKSDVAPLSHDWHGTMTSVTACGNGFLSRGIYRGLASDARVVLVKVSEQGRITEANIARGVRWVIENRERYNIRILNISLGGDADVSSRDNPVDQAAEEAVRAGIVVIAAAGNSGCTDDHQTMPPANSPSVIAVGGYNDYNRLRPERVDLYCSSFGTTVDGLVKPELIAPAMLIAAPILPLTPAWTQAETLDRLLSAPDYLLSDLVRQHSREAGLSASLQHETAETIRAEIESLIQKNKFISTHYQHVDGTSFAAPIVASVVAQMLEARPELTPAGVRHILIATADRLRYQPLLRQGYGMINARRAVQQALSETHLDGLRELTPPRIFAGQLLFTHHDDKAQSVALAGEFNDWRADEIFFVKETDGLWRVAINLPAPGIYRYKFVIDAVSWLEDRSHGMKEPDQFGGFTSLLHIA